MKIEEFRKTGMDVAHLGDAISDCRWDDCAPQPGRVYIGCLYIERHPDGWSLPLERGEFEGELADLEEMLFKWAAEEGYFSGINESEF